MNRQPYIIGMLALVLIALVTVPTLQTIPNGSQHYYMIDAGETQIVLNTWGTLHATGYPLYVMTGNSLTAWFRALGAAPAAAPSLVSFAWGMVALALIFALMRRIARNDWIAAGVTIVFALTRTAWIHLVIPEIYSFTLVFLALLLLVGLDSGRADGRSSGSPLPMRRVFWLALIGGVAVAHHRAVALAAPALIVAAWGALFSRSVSLWRAGLRLLICVALALIGFLPYVYLPLRAHGGAAWVYGDPGTLSGFLDQFLGREASRFIGVPSTWDALRANFELVTDVLIIDVSLVGIALGIIGLLVGIRARDTRRAAILLALVGGAAFAFHVFYYTDVLSALILMVTLSLAGGWALLAFHLTPRPSRTGGHIWLVPDSPHPEVGRGGADAERTDFAAAINTRRTFPVSTWRGVRLFFAVSAAIASIALYAQNQPFIAALTRDPAGLDAITLARSVPPDATLMLPWGVHHFAVGFARDVTGEIGGFDLVDHNADFSTNGA
ncbi:MAG: DUF2723 domain-containing protein, partial [Chloroflexota bacterium]|nr:DUF2723 domain-containing protein [Chloroflexota bacterium]